MFMIIEKKTFWGFLKRAKKFKKRKVSALHLKFKTCKTSQSNTFSFMTESEIGEWNPVIPSTWISQHFSLIWIVNSRSLHISEQTSVCHVSGLHISQSDWLCYNFARFSTKDLRFYNIIFQFYFFHFLSYLLQIDDAEWSLMHFSFFLFFNFFLLPVQIKRRGRKIFKKADRRDNNACSFYDFTILTYSPHVLAHTLIKERVDYNSLSS